MARYSDTPRNQASGNTPEVEQWIIDQFVKEDEVIPASEYEKADPIEMERFDKILSEVMIKQWEDYKASKLAKLQTIENKEGARYAQIDDRADISFKDYLDRARNFASARSFTDVPYGKEELYRSQLMYGKIYGEDREQFRASALRGYNRREQEKGKFRYLGTR